MKWVPYIAAGSLFASIAVTASPLPTQSAVTLSCQGNLIPLPFPLAPDEDDPVQHRACHAVCCKRKDQTKSKTQTA